MIKHKIFRSLKCSRGGEHNINIQEGSEETIQASALFTHQSYNPRTMDNDIALIKLSKPFKLTDHVSTACLPSIEAPTGTNCFITGLCSFFLMRSFYFRSSFLNIRFYRYKQVNIKFYGYQTFCIINLL